MCVHAYLNKNMLQSHYIIILYVSSTYDFHNELVCATLDM